VINFASPKLISKKGQALRLNREENVISTSVPVFSNLGKPEMGIDDQYDLYE
jgi:hypothetical protein